MAGFDCAKFLAEMVKQTDQSLQPRVQEFVCSLILQECVRYFLACRNVNWVMPNDTHDHDYFACGDLATQFSSISAQCASAAVGVVEKEQDPSFQPSCCSWKSTY